MANRHAIEDLFGRWGWGQDSLQFDYVKDALAPDARMTVDIADKPAVVQLDGAAISEFIESSTRQQTGTHRHLITNLHLEEEREDSARAIAYLTVMVTEDGKLFPQTTGVYRADVVRRNGDWRFQSIHLALDRPF